MRGTPIDTNYQVRSVGIIPAYAGNTQCRPWIPSAPLDHPRVCGEHDFESCCRAVNMGSSPRMRGTPFDIDGVMVGVGIIPAYAGNTGVHPFLDIHVRDHPRVCGEHEVSEHLLGHLQGSSPRMRGTRDTLAIPLMFGGIIPAYAGNTLRM